MKNFEVLKLCFGLYYTILCNTKSSSRRLYMGFYQKGKYKNSRQAKKSFRKRVKTMKKLFPNATDSSIKRVLIKET